MQTGDILAISWYFRVNILTGTRVHTWPCSPMVRLKMTRIAGQSLICTRLRLIIPVTILTSSAERFVCVHPQKVHALMHASIHICNVLALRYRTIVGRLRGTFDSCLLCWLCTQKPARFSSTCIANSGKTRISRTHHGELNYDIRYPILPSVIMTCAVDARH